MPKSDTRADQQVSNLTWDVDDHLFMIVGLVPMVAVPVPGRVRLPVRRRPRSLVEVLVPRHELAVLNPQVNRPGPTVAQGLASTDGAETEPIPRSPVTSTPGSG